MKINYLLSSIKEKFNHKEEILDASKAYLKSRYQDDETTKEKLIENMIRCLNRRIKSDIRLDRSYLNISTFTEHREKMVLPEIVKFFESHGYKVTLLNGEDFKEVNVLIINWQGKEMFA